MDEMKWYMIGMAVIMTGMFCSFAYSDYAKSECKIEAVRNHVSVAEAEKLCN
jgi:hypothetical protein